MAVDNPKVVDFAGVDKATGEVVLTIADHLPWDNKEHLLLLQEKINTYLAFIESGEIQQSFPSAKDRPLRIDVTCEFEPDVEAQHFLSRAAAIVRSAGFLLSWRVFAQPSAPADAPALGTKAKTDDGSHVWLPEDIAEKLQADFPNESLGALQSLLREYQGKELPRVLRCIVHLSQGDTQRLLHYIAAANEDCRDLIYWAEYDKNDQRTHDFNQPFDAQPALPADGLAPLGRR